VHAHPVTAVCKHGNLLLCTLLLGNTVINSAISIILSSVTNGAVGLLTSTFVILLLGEWSSVTSGAVGLLTSTHCRDAAAG